MNSEAGVIEIVEQQLDLDRGQVTAEASFDGLGVDSPRLLEIALAIELQFGIEVPDAALARFRLISDIVKFVEQQTRSRADQPPGLRSGAAPPLRKN